MEDPHSSPHMDERGAPVWGGSALWWWGGDVLAAGNIPLMFKYATKLTGQHEEKQLSCLMATVEVML